MSNHESEEILDRMAVIRRKLDHDVEAVVEDAKELTDWRGFVKRHPLLTVAAATAVGFFVVPKRLNIISPDAETLEKLAKKNRLVVKAKPDVRRQAGAVNPLINLVGGALMRSAFAMAGQRLSTAVASSQSGDVRNASNTDSVSQ